MTKKLFSIILLLCSVFNSFSEDVNMNQVHKGEAVLRSTLDFIEKNDFTDSSIRKLTGNVNENSIQLGFGLQQYCDGISGGGVSVNINYVVFKEQLIKMSIEIYGYDNIKNHIGADLQERYSKIFSRYGGYKYRYENDLNYEKYNDYKKEIVGECKAVVIPQEYKEYYDRLYSVDECEPLSSNIYGYAYGIAGAKPDGRIAMEKLLKLNDKDIFISLLKGDHPAGRIYAAEGLLRLENSKENVDLINQIFSTLVRNGIRYTTANGCIIMDEEYEYYKYDRNRKFPEIDDNE
jgi:hypothetical protein